jgi:hypothetical protein
MTLSPRRAKTPGANGENVCNFWLPRGSVLVTKILTMKMENAIRILAGSMVLISLGLSVLVSHYWLLLNAFVGLNLIQSAFTGFCPAELVLARLGVGQKKESSSGKCCCG